MSDHLAAQPDPARPWKIATVVLAVALALTLGMLSQRMQAAPPAETPVLSGPASATGAGPTAAPSADASRDAFYRSLAKRQEGDPMAKGSIDAPVVMIEWADYRCPFCSVFAEDTLPQLQSLIDDGTLRIEFRDMAIFGEDSVNAAAGARAAGAQGKFWEFQAALYKRLPNQGHPDVKDDLVLEVAKEVGVAELAAFEAAYRSEETRQAVAKDTSDAQSLGVNSTPTFLVGTQVVQGAQPADAFKEVIKAERAKAS